MTPNFETCPVCQFGAFRDEIPGEIYYIKCLRCGPFRITIEAIRFIENNYSEDNRLFASSKINHFFDRTYVFNESDIDKLKNISIPSVDERALNLLLCFAKHYPRIGTGPSMSEIEHFLVKGPTIDKTDHSNIVAKFVFDSLSRTFSPKRKELEYLIRDYHVSETEFITLDKSNNLELSPKGWARLDELKYKQQESNIGFIAMKFLPELEEYAKKWFEGGIKDAGYEAEAMYDHPHLNLIDNEMIALIRRSKFLVCDMTKNSRGAYYEAGFAHGLNIPVIFLCEKDFFDKKENELSTDAEGVHFDTNHYPIIIWEYDKGVELKIELQYWIEKTIGRGLL